MSIYATLWRLKFPRYGNDHTGCEWVEVLAQGVPAHVGTPTPGFGYEAGDPYAAFLPPPVEVDAEDDGRALRAVVIVTEGTPKGTHRSGQEYIDPLLVLSGDEYGAISFSATSCEGTGRIASLSSGRTTGVPDYCSRTAPRRTVGRVSLRTLAFRGGGDGPLRPPGGNL